MADQCLKDPVQNGFNELMRGKADEKFWERFVCMSNLAISRPLYDLRKKGQQLGANDLMIAAHARSLGAVIVTNNLKDFGRVKGLRVENWLD
jgi:predicted nucleic acid-binding protein